MIVLACWEDVSYKFPWCWKVKTSYVVSPDTIILLLLLCTWLTFDRVTPVY